MDTELTGSSGTNPAECRMPAALEGTPAGY